MKHPVLFTLAVAPLIGLSLAFFACDTGDLNVPEQPDSGNGYCPVTTPSVYCDAAGVTQGCSPEPDSGIAALSELAPGTYPVECKTQSYVINNQLGNGQNCQVTYTCTCQVDGGWTCSQ